VSYVTASTPEEASTFYQAELATLGWQPKAEAVVAEAMALQDFTRADQQLALTITANEEGTTVLIVVGPIDP